MQDTKRVRLSWLVAVLGSFLGLLALVIFGMGGGPSDQSGELPRFVAHVGMGLLGLCLIVGSNVALRRRRLAGMIFLACLPFVAFCLTCPNAGYLVWRSRTGWFDSPFPGMAAFLTFLFFAPFIVLFFTLHRRRLLRYLFPISACLAWIPFGLNYWARALLPGLIGWSIFILLFALFWMGTDRRGWPPLVESGENLGHLIRYPLLLGVLLGLVFWADGRATLIAGSLLWLIVLPGEPRRRKRIYASVAMGIFLAIATALKVEAYVFRHRSERLLADVKSLEMRKTTYADARRVLQKWPEMRTFEGGETGRGFEVSLDDRVTPEHELTSSRSDATDWAWRFFGWHQASVYAQIRIQRGVVWEEYFSVLLEIPSAALQDHVLIGTIDTLSHFYYRGGAGLDGLGRDSLILQTLIHPEYILEHFEGDANYDTLPIPHISEMRVRVTPYADTATIRQLAEFDFSCITRWFSCRNAEELMPTAWAEYQRDQPQAVAAANQLKCTPEMVMAQAGNAEMAGVVEVTGNHTDTFAGQNHAAATVRMVQPLGGDVGGVGDPFDFWVSPWELADTSAGDALTLPQGKRFILLFFGHGPLPHLPGVWPYPCGVIPWSKENLALVQRGIANDPRANDPPPYIY